MRVNPALGKSLLANQPTLNRENEVVNERPCLKTQGRWLLRSVTPGSDLHLPHIRMYRCTYEHTTVGTFGYTHTAKDISLSKTKSPEDKSGVILHMKIPTIVNLQQGKQNDNGGFADNEMETFVQQSQTPSSAN